MMDLLEVKNRLFEIRRYNYQKKKVDTDIAVLCHLLEWAISELEHRKMPVRDTFELPFVRKERKQ